MEKKMYSVRVIPTVEKKGEDDDGKAIIKATYIRDTKEIKKGDEVLFPKSKFMHLEVFEQDKENPLGGDFKPFTLNIFQSAHPLLFDAIAEMMEDESKYTEQKTARKARILNSDLPGLVRIRPSEPYFAMTIGENGARKKLKANVRQDNGNFDKEDVIRKDVRYFLFANQVNEEDDAVMYRNELDTAYKSKVTATTPTSAPEAEVEETAETE